MSKSKCTAHHNACDCREEAVRKLIEAADQMCAALKDHEKDGTACGFCLRRADKYTAAREKVK